MDIGWGIQAVYHFEIFNKRNPERNAWAWAVNTKDVFFSFQVMLLCQRPSVRTKPADIYF